MGAWDIGPFDNDDASDWLYDLEASNDVAYLAETIQVVIEMSGDYLESPDCANALAAAEIIAALRGHPILELPDNAEAWVEAHRKLDVSSLVPPALAAIQRIRTQSELKDQWDDSEEAAKWYATLGNLTKRLSAK
jgi:hypothetical protein